jgi:hypothetical protein
MIDAYSRYAVAVFIETSVTYYDCSCCQADSQRLESTGIRPEFFRSDRGSETMLLANAQLQFEQFEILTPLLIAALDTVHPSRIAVLKAGGIKCQPDRRCSGGREK